MNIRWVSMDLQTLSTQGCQCHEYPMGIHCPIPAPVHTVPVCLEGCLRSKIVPGFHAVPVYPGMPMPWRSNGYALSQSISHCPTLSQPALKGEDCPGSQSTQGCQCHGYPMGCRLPQSTLKTGSHIVPVMPMPWISNGYPWICRLSQSFLSKPSTIHWQRYHLSRRIPQSMDMQLVPVH